jgi:tRNA threonylcarbamoyl adenosine modification protein (Sua5/YciO/YrdC/YwlC family)
MTEWMGIHDHRAPQRSADILSNGGLVILPTDTVYGVAADPWQPRAVAALYGAKHRPPDRAIPVLLADFDHIRLVAASVPEAVRKLAKAFWPGPLTIAIPRLPDLPEVVSSLPTVGVRIPDHDATRAIIRAASGALAVTSANLSGQASPITAQDAADMLGDTVALVLDGGTCPGGVASTVVDITGPALRVIRHGPLTEDDLLNALK